MVCWWAVLLCGLGAVSGQRISPETQKLLQERLQKNPDYLRQAAKKLSEGMADFTQDFYLQLANTSSSPNFVFSPLSLHSALAMLYLGTTLGSNTSQELALALGVANSHDLLKLAYHTVIQIYTKEASFQYGNKFWAQKGFNVKKKFAITVNDNLDSEVETIDFDLRDSVEKVNKWISRKTEGQITDLVESFSPGTKLFIANALYFKEQWLVPFEDKDLVTGEKVKDSFRAPKGTINVPMIEQKGSYIIYKEIKTHGLNIEVVIIPYKNTLFEMHLYLPEDDKDMARMEAAMQDSHKRDAAPGDPAYFNLFSTSDQTDPDDFIEEVYLKMPTFKIREDTDAGEILQNLGVDKVFSDSAELGGISDDKGLSVSSIRHTAVVEVTKDGTEGSAATGVEIALFSADFGIQKDVVVNRPFIFVVQDIKNKIPVLVGKVTDPSK